jgi:hypothetical protein
MLTLLILAVRSHLAWALDRMFAIDLNRLH